MSTYGIFFLSKKRCVFVRIQTIVSSHTCSCKLWVRKKREIAALSKNKATALKVNIIWTPWRSLRSVLWWLQKFITHTSLWLYLVSEFPHCCVAYSLSILVHWNRIIDAQLLKVSFWLPEQKYCFQQRYFLAVPYKGFSQHDILMDINQSETTHGKCVNELSNFYYVLFALHWEKFGTLVMETFECLTVSNLLVFKNI